jgi:hypothetical protein
MMTETSKALPEIEEQESMESSIQKKDKKMFRDSKYSYKESSDDEL